MFVGGCDRSGTTLLGSLLGSCEGCLATPESQFKAELAPYREGGGRDGGGQLDDPDRAVRTHWRFRLWNVPYRDRDTPSRDLRQAVLRAVDDYAAAHDRPAPTRWIDHTPNNLRHAPLLQTWFPEARFVHVVRDPRAVAASVLPLDWGPNTPERAAQWWLRQVAPCLAAELRLGPERIVRVRFEELVRSPGTTLPRLASFLDLPDLGSSDVPNGFRPPAYTGAQHRRVGGALDPSRSDAYRERLSERAIELIESVAGPTMRLLGYTPDGDARPAPATALERIAGTVTEMARGTTNRLRKRRRRTRAIR